MLHATDEFIDFRSMQKPEERHSLSKFGEVIYRFAMRGRYVDPYKRVTSREHISAYDNKEENTGTFHLIFVFVKLVAIFFFFFSILKNGVK